jgi:hypothetical protein
VFTTNERFLCRRIRSQCGRPSLPSGNILYSLWTTRRLSSKKVRKLRDVIPRSPNKLRNLHHGRNYINGGKDCRLNHFWIAPSIKW